MLYMIIYYAYKFAEKCIHLVYFKSNLVTKSIFCFFFAGKNHLRNILSVQEKWYAYHTIVYNMRLQTGNYE